LNALIKQIFLSNLAWNYRGIFVGGKLMLKFYYLLLGIILIVPVFGQNDTIDVTFKVHEASGKNLRLFERDELLELSLRFDITTFRKQKSKLEYLPALLTLYLNKTDSVNKEIKIKARGNVRLNICSFPPIRINFKKSESSNDEFVNVDKIKMVTHCQPGNQIYLLKEYLIYKLYNVLTDYSYRVRLAKINYINTAKNSKPVIEYAFFIEPAEILGKRIKGTEVLTTNLTQKNIKPEMMDRMAIFNYMIGNTDWSVPIKHNVTIFGQGLSANPNLGVIVPYDFDYSGLNNTNYAVPFETLGLKSVLERRYLGICRSQDVFQKELKEFLEKKNEFIKVINDFPYLNVKSKKEMIMYLEGFFRDFDKHNIIVYKLLNECLDF
jgi:hypothetical protein